MPILPRLRGVLSNLAGRGPVHRDLDAEVGSYLDMLVDEHVARGLSPEDARRQARLDMEGVEQVKEAVRSARPAVWLDTLVRDIRFSVRILLKTPAFSLTAILVLALSIGANVAVFSVVNILAFKPMPGADEPGTLVGIYQHDPSRPDSYSSFSFEEFDAVRRETVFAGVMAHRTFKTTIIDGETTRRVQVALATGGYFETLGVRLRMGRSFTREEERPGSRASVLVLSHAGWQSLGAPADIVGRTLVVNSSPFAVVGVAPEGFAGAMVFAGPTCWLPLGAAPLILGDPAGDTPDADLDRNLLVVGRLRPEVSIEAANAALRSASARFQLASPQIEPGRIVTVARHARSNDGTRPTDDSDLVAPLVTLMAAPLVILMIASLNVANMQLARSSARRREIAMRLALGAGRGRVVSQMLTEGLLLSIAGGTIGLLCATWVLREVLASFTPIVDRAIVADVSPDWRVCLAALLCSAVATVASTLGPALRSARLDLRSEMAPAAGTRSRMRGWRIGPSNLLVAGQTALSLGLLAAAGLFVRGAVAADRAEPGYRFDHQWLLRVDASPGGAHGEAGRQVYARLLERLRSTPGVASATLASQVAFGNQSFSRRVWRPDQTAAPVPGAPRGIQAQSYEIGAGYFETLQLSMLRGREFTPAEELDRGADGVVVIDEPAAASLFPGRDALGQVVQVVGDRGGSDVRALRIVGIAPGLRHRLTDRVPVPHVYLPIGAHFRPVLNVHVRDAAGPGTDPGVMRRTLRDTAGLSDSRLTVLTVQTMAEARDAMPMNWIVRAGGRTFGAFGLIALFMAAAGLYGVKAYLVTRRTREIGIRQAIGATEGDVIRMILGEGALLLVAGGAGGVLLALGGGMAVSSMLVGVEPFDPVVLSATTALLSVTVLAACYLPARKATRVAPVVALRTE